MIPEFLRRPEPPEEWQALRAVYAYMPRVQSRDRQGNVYTVERALRWAERLAREWLP